MVVAAVVVVLMVVILVVVVDAITKVSFVEGVLQVTTMMH